MSVNNFPQTTTLARPTYHDGNFDLTDDVGGATLAHAAFQQLYGRLVGALEQADAAAILPDTLVQLLPEADDSSGRSLHVAMVSKQTTNNQQK